MDTARPVAARPPALVSCLLPTKNRAAYIPTAIQSYLSQTYPHKELVIVDNGEDGTHRLVPEDPSIRYVHVRGSLTTGEMRNVCAIHAKGEILCHFDSDDWSAPERVTDQMTRLGSTGMVTGYSNMLFYDERTGKCYHWQHPNQQRYALGTSLCYRRVWWEKNPFPSIRVGEDSRFFQQALRTGKTVTTTVPANKLMVARIHAQQTSRKSLGRTSYRPVPRTALPAAYPCVLISSVI